MRARPWRTALPTASRAIRSSASRQSGGTSTRGVEVELQPRADPVRDVLGRLAEREVERLVDRAAERGDRPARLVERALDRVHDLLERLAVVRLGG